MQNNSFHSAPPTISQNFNIYEDTIRYYEYSRAYLQKITTRFQRFCAFRHVVRKPEIEPAIIDLHALKLAPKVTLKVALKVAPKVTLKVTLKVALKVALKVVLKVALLVALKVAPKVTLK